MLFVAQKLNIEIIKEGKTLANALFRWSGYTSSAIRLTQQIIEKQQDLQQEDDLLFAIKLLTQTYAVLHERDYKEAKKLYPNENLDFEGDQYSGLITFTEEGIEETRRWEEARVEILIDKKQINLKTFHFFDKQEYCRDYRMKEEDYKKIPTFNFKIDEIPYSEFPDIKDFVFQSIKNSIFTFKYKENEIIKLIE